MAPAPPAEVRDFDEQDLGSVVELVQGAEPTAVESVFSLADVVGVLTGDAERGRAVVGVRPDGAICGVAVARIESDRAWLLRWTVAGAQRGAGLGAALIDKLERRLVGQGVSSLLVLVPPMSAAVSALERLGYGLRSGVSVVEKRQLRPSAVEQRAQALGAEQVPPDLWGRIGGVEHEKSIIEESIVLPLAHPETAAAHGVVPPSAAILFGPPGTGKTTFAKAIAARLGWPFVEILASQLAADTPHGQARALRERVEAILQLDGVVAFIDEVDDLAGARRTGAGSPALTNELLKVVPRFREGGRLLVCATNAIGALDPAFTRPGRFDCLIPIGPPDAAARASIWRAHAARGRIADVDFAALADRSEGFSAADIEFAAGRAAHRVFRRALADGAADPVAQTADFEQAIAGARASITAAQLEEFRRDAERYARP